MEHFLIFLSLQKPVNRLSLYFIIFLYVEGKDGEVILISEHHKFLFETYLIIGERTEGKGGGGRGVHMSFFHTLHEQLPPPFS